MKISLDYGFKVRYKRKILNADGSVAFESDWKNNLITDSGLDFIPVFSICDCFTRGVVGTGVLTTRRDAASAGVTVALSGGILTSSGSFWVVGDVGRTFKFNDGPGTECKITAFTDATHVTTSTGGSVASNTGTTWLTDLTGVASEAKRTGAYQANVGDNSSTFLTDTWTHKRTYLFSAEVGAVTYKCVGWAPTLGGNCFGVDQIPGLGDSLLAGQQYVIAVELSVKLSPTTITAVGDVGNNGFNTAGNAMIEEALVTGYSVIATTGATSGAARLEPIFNNVACRAANATWTQNTSVASTPISPPAGTDSVVFSPAGYVNGTFTRTGSTAFPTSSANGSIYGFLIGGSSLRGFSVKFTSAQTKVNTRTLTITIRYTWGRILTN